MTIEQKNKKYGWSNLIRTHDMQNNCYEKAKNQIMY